jgi:hypothetical protein
VDTMNGVTIENLTNWLKSLKLNSGTVLHIPPRSTSQAIAGVEVQDNTEVDKLLRQCSIAVHEIDPAATEIEPSPGT